MALALVIRDLEFLIPQLQELSTGTVENHPSDASMTTTAKVLRDLASLVDFGRGDGPVVASAK
jgi:hypothetical protein